MAQAIVNSLSSFSQLCTDLMAAWKQDKYLRISWTTKRNRTLDQNALWAAMYQRISETLSDGSAADIEEQKAYCKLMIGVPILRRDCERFNRGYHEFFLNRPYSHQIFLMGPNPLFGVDGFPVTRLLDTKQGAEYTESVVEHFVSKGVFFEDLLNAKAG